MNARTGAAVAKPATISAWPATLSPPAHLAYCIQRGGVTFLDVRRDRYFGLPADLEAVFEALVQAGFRVEALTPGLEQLIALGVLVLGEGDKRPQTLAATPSESWLDAQIVPVGDAGPLDVARAARSVLTAKHMLGRLSLESIIARLRARRPGLAVMDEAMRPLALSFAKARRWTPVEPVCLLDSLAMLDAFHRRGHHPHLVFGVIRQPFAAHCWLQIDGVVINDRLDHVAEYTPILVV